MNHILIHIYFLIKFKNNKVKRFVRFFEFLNHRIVVKLTNSDIKDSSRISSELKKYFQTNYQYDPHGIQNCTNKNFFKKYKSRM